MSPNDYLTTFFATMERLQPAEDYGLSHGIIYENGALLALVGMGDVRAKIRLPELDPDPMRMAAVVMELWRSCPEEDMVFDQD